MIRGQPPSDPSVSWDYEQYAAVKLGLTQPPTWAEWSTMDWRTVRRWMAFDEEARAKQKREMEEQQNKMRFG